MTKTLLALAALDYAADKRLPYEAFQAASTVKFRAFTTFLGKLQEKRLVVVHRGKALFSPATIELTPAGINYLRNHAK